MVKEDPCFDDLEYVVELDWVKSEIEVCGCVCCYDFCFIFEGFFVGSVDVLV